MSATQLLGLMCLLGSAIGAIILLAHVAQRRIDLHGSLWRHIFRS